MTDDIREYKRLLEEIRWLDADLQGKDFLLTWEQNLKEVQQVIYTAEALKWLYKNNISAKCFDSGLAILQINDRASLAQVSCPVWSRLSFGLAANSLGLTVHQMDKDEGQFQPAYFPVLKETQFIGILDTYPGYTTGGTENNQKFLQGGPDASRRQKEDNSGHVYMKELSVVLDSWGSSNEAPFQRPGVINLQCDLDHPIQAMADILVLKHHFGSLERLWGKKIAVTWVYAPSDTIPSSVPQGFLALVSRFNTDVILAYPEGYGLNPRVMETVRSNAENSDGSFAIAQKMDQALKDADAVYIMTWPGGNGSEQGSALEGWTYNEAKMKLTKDSKAFLMDSKPAMEYKSYIIAAMMLNHRFKEPAKLLGSLRKRNVNRLLFPV